MPRITRIRIGRARRAVIALATVAVAAPAAGCGSSDTSSSRTTSAKKSLEIGIITFSTSDVITNRLVADMTKDAKGRGWKVQFVDGNADAAKANSAIRTLVTKGVDAIVVTVFDSKALSAGLAVAQQRKVPVLSIGGGLAPGVVFSTDDGMGEPMAEKLLADIGGRGTVLHLAFHPGLSCRQRAQAFDRMVKSKPEIDVTEHEIQIPGAAQVSKSFTLAWLAAKQKARGKLAIFNCYDDNALGAIAALKQAGRKDVGVYSFDATDPALQAIKEGWMTATLWLDLAYAGSEAIASIPKVLEAGAAWKPREIPLKYDIVTKDNVADFERKHASDG